MVCGGTCLPIVSIPSPARFSAPTFSFEERTASQLHSFRGLFLYAYEE